MGIGGLSPLKSLTVYMLRRWCAASLIDYHVLKSGYHHEDTSPPSYSSVTFLVACDESLGLSALECWVCLLTQTVNLIHYIYIYIYMYSERMSKHAAVSSLHTPFCPLADGHICWLVTCRDVVGEEFKVDQVGDGFA